MFKNSYKIIKKEIILEIIMKIMLIMIEDDSF